MIRNLLGLLLIAALLGLGSAAVYEVNAVWALQQDGSYDVYCPVTWNNKQIYQVRYEYKYFKYDDQKTCLKCGPCYSSGMQCVDVYSECPPGAV